MSKRSLRPLAAVLKLIDQLSDNERADLYDYLRPERKKPAGKSSSGAQAAGKRSSSASKSKVVGAQSTSTETAKEPAAQAASGAAGGD